MPFDAHPWEQEPEVEGHDLLQWNGCVNRFRLFISQVGWDGDESGKNCLRHLHAGQQTLPCLRVIDQGCHIQAEVAHKRKGMSRIHRQGSQHRKNGGLEVVVDPESLPLIELFVIEQMGTLMHQLTFELAAVVLLLPLQQRGEMFPNRLQLFQRCTAVLTAFVDAGFHLGLEGGHPHHEKFVEVVAEDGAEFRLLQQGGAFIQRLNQHTLVEGDPAEFPIDVEVGGENFVTHRVTGGARTDSRKVAIAKRQDCSPPAADQLKKSLCS